MDLFMDFPLLSMFIAVVAIFIFVKVLTMFVAGNRRIGRQCTHCGTALPGNANFCRRCGNKVGGGRNPTLPR